MYYVSSIVLSLQVICKSKPLTMANPGLANYCKFKRLEIRKVHQKTTEIPQHRTKCAGSNRNSTISMENVFQCPMKYIIQESAAPAMVGSLAFLLRTAAR